MMGTDNCFSVGGRIPVNSCLSGCLSLRFYFIEFVYAFRWDLTTPRILTMEFLDGGQINDLKYIQEHNINPHEISDKLGRLYSRMIFINGFVHSDPHPGNILVKQSDKGECDIILLDHGLYAVSFLFYNWI